MNRLVLAALVGLAGCQNFSDVAACDDQTRELGTPVTVVDTSCYTYRTPILGTSCTSTPRTEYQANAASRDAMQICMRRRSYDRDVAAKTEELRRTGRLGGVPIDLSQPPRAR